MNQTVDSRAFCPVFQVLDPDTARRRSLQEIFLRCDLSVQVLAGAERLETFPDACSLVLLHDSLDERSDQLVDKCVAKGHGVVLYREDHQLPRVVDLLARGAAGYLRWPFDCDDLRRTIGAVERSGHARTRFFALHARATALIERLSPREKQVLILVSAGRTSKDIARALGVSTRTIEHHRANILSRLKVSPPSAMRLGIYAGLDWHEPWQSDSELASPPADVVAMTAGRDDDTEA